MASLFINGIEMPEPKLNGLIFTKEKIWASNTRRDSNTGTMSGDLIAIKNKLQIEWGVLTPDDISKIDNAVSPAFITVKFIDPKTNKFTTKTMYAGTATYPVYTYTRGTLYQGVKVDLIER